MRQVPSKFVRASYDKNNNSGISRFIPYLKKKGFSVPYKEEDYNVDVIAYKNGVEYRFEIEIKDKEFTTVDTYPFRTVSFLGRKEKFHNEQQFWYVLISPRTNWFLFCNSSKIYRKEYIETIHIDTLYRKGDDKFYRVPKELCEFRNLNE